MSLVFYNNLILPLYLTCHSFFDEVVSHEVSHLPRIWKIQFTLKSELFEVLCLGIRLTGLYQQKCRHCFTRFLNITLPPNYLFQNVYGSYINEAGFYSIWSFCFYITLCSHFLRFSHINIAKHQIFDVPCVAVI